MTIKNPILPGFRPDPSICRVGEDFYLVTSSFEYFPGIPIYHSKDLIHWEQIGHVLTRSSQVTMTSGAPNCINIYAPTIRYHDGTFYVIVTNVNGDNHGNFLMTATDPAGAWSDPVALPFPGIDPSLFFDDNGKTYYLGSDGCIFIQELDVKTGEAKGDQHIIWCGTANNPEGPHLYKIDGVYYLLIAQGGTELCHMGAMARSETIFGAYEPCPHNPVLTNIGTSLPIKGTGHADLVEDGKGNWWAVCLGFRPLGYPFRHNMGRETFLVPVKRLPDGWFVFGADMAVLPEFFNAPNLPPYTPRGYVPGSDVQDDFQGEKMHLMWNGIYNPVPDLIKRTKKGLQMKGNRVSLWEDAPKAWLGKRQEHFECVAKTLLDFTPKQDREEAGLTIYMNPGHHYEVAKTRLNGQNFVIFRRRIGSLHSIEALMRCDANPVGFRLECDKDWYQFYYAVTEGDWISIGSGETQYLTTEAGGCFTGNYIALYASGNGEDCKSPATFTSFAYRAVQPSELEEDAES